MRTIYSTTLAVAVLTLTLPPVAHVATGGIIIKSIAKYIGKETGKEATEQAVTKMSKEVGEQLIERTTERVVREGGEKSLIEVGDMVAKHGPEVVRALDNAPDAIPVLRLLDELPADDIGKAASRLAAGSTGKELATLSTKLGSTVLRAEAKHPGVGYTFARALGNDGADLSLKLSSEQAMQIGRHVDEIAQLPATQQSQLLALISSNADRFTSFVGRFVEKNPGMVLFTAASTTLILAESERFLGGDEIVFDPAGNPIMVTKPGIVGRAGKAVTDTVMRPVQVTLYALGAVVVLFVATFLGLRVWSFKRKDRSQDSEAKASHMV